MDWEGENGSNRVLRNDKNLIIRATAADNTSKASHGPEQPIDRNFNKKLDIIKAEFQLEFRKIRDQITKEVAKITA
jgi:hypothetical protein